MAHVVGLPADSSDEAVIFSRIASLLYASDDFDSIHQALCDAAVDLIPGCDHASLMVSKGKGFATAAASDAVARKADELERQFDDGPCVDAIEDEGPQLDADLTVNPSWPRLAEQLVARTPIRGTVAFRLLVDGKKAGALNVFCDEPGAVTSETVDQAAVLAAFASAVLVAAHKREEASSLRFGMESNREIGQALGLIMGYNNLSADAAFDLLRETSQKMNVRLATLAHQVVEQQNETAARDAGS